jgi:hypothetical protein
MKLLVSALLNRYYFCLCSTLRFAPLVTNKCQIKAAALDLAKVIATKSPIALLGTKHLLLHARDHGVQENLNYTQAWNSAMLQTDVCHTCLSLRLTCMMLILYDRGVPGLAGFETSNFGIHYEETTRVQAHAQVVDLIVWTRCLEFPIAVSETHVRFII